MKKILCLTLGLALMASQAAAAKATPKTKAAAKPASTSVAPAPAAKPATSSAMVEQPGSALTPENQELAPNIQMDDMKPGLSYNFLMDLKVFNMTNANYGTTSSWYLYSTYRAIVANVFNNGLGILGDIEKPGYADSTYPTLKVNELYAKYKQGNLYAKLGRQIFGDTQDLLLGFQNDAVGMGVDLNTIDLEFFFAKVDLLMPWGGNMGGMIGAVPTFYFGSTMGLKAYLLIGTESATVTPAGGTPHDVINSLVYLGAKYFLDMPVGNAGMLDIGAQLGIQTAMARNAADQTIDATNLGLKLDGSYGIMPGGGKFGFKVGAHVVYTGGADATTATPKYSFISPNALVGSGPGIFCKIQDGGGPFTYVDAHARSAKIQNYAGVLASGVTGDFSIGPIEPGAGFWTYSDTDRNGTALGAEFDEWIVWHAVSALSFYQQAGFFFPNQNVPGTTLNTAIKFVLGTSLKF